VRRGKNGAARRAPTIIDQREPGDQRQHDWRDGQGHRAKDDEAQKRVEQGGWYVVTKNDYKRWLARQQRQPIGAPDFADIAGQDLHEAVSASPPLPVA
jgi:hypothetical protein